MILWWVTFAIDHSDGSAINAVRSWASAASWRLTLSDWNAEAPVASVGQRLWQMGHIDAVEDTSRPRPPYAPSPGRSVLLGWNALDRRGGSFREGLDLDNDSVKHEHKRLHVPFAHAVKRGLQRPEALSEDQVCLRCAHRCRS